MRFFYKRNRFHQLKGFCTVMQWGSIAKAGDIMRVSPSSISLQIQALERDIGVKLFYRVKQRLQPTEEAYSIYRVALEHLEGIDHIYEDTANLLKEKVSKSIRVAGHSYALSHLIPKPLKQLIEKCDNKLQYKLFNITREEAIESLYKREVDVAVYPVEQEYKDIIIEDVFNEKCKTVLAMSKEHPIAKIHHKEITWDTLKKYNIAHIGKGVTMQGLKFNLAKHKIYSMVDITHNCTWEIGKGLIKENIIVGFFESHYLNESDKQEIETKDISHLLPDYSFQALYHKDTKAQIVKDFISILKNNLL